MAQISVENIAVAVDGHTPAQIAAGVARLAYQGEIRAGDRMPVVKDVARHLCVSAGTVAAAWKILGGLGLVESRGRTGTLVLPQPNNWLPPRYRTGDDANGPVTLNLSEGTPDPDLLPDVSGALALIARNHPTLSVDSYFDPPVDPTLGRLLEEDWPYHAQCMTVVDGAGDALIRTLMEAARFGDRVAVENPGYPPLLDMLDLLGLAPVPMEMDSSGVTCESLVAAMMAGVTVIVLQPRAQNPTGVSMTKTRVRALAQTLKRFDRSTRPLVVEDDHSGLVTGVRQVSLGAYVPDDVVRIQSYSKAFGPDIRLAAVSGPAALVDSIVARRLLGAGWTSHLLQRLLASLLADPSSQAQISAAIAEYRRRAAALAAELSRHDVRVEPGDGLTMWIPVHDEDAAANRLLAAGIRVSVGRQFAVSGRGSPVGRRGAGHIRVSLGALRNDDIHDVAELVARGAVA